MSSKHFSDEPEIKTMRSKIIETFVKDNGSDHHTARFAHYQQQRTFVDLTVDEEDRKPDPPIRMVVRRGQEFKIRLAFQKEIDLTKEKLYIILKTGSNPMRRDRSEVHVQVYPTPHTADQCPAWTAHTDSTCGTEFTFFIKSCSECIVGVWNISLVVESKDEFDSSYTQINVEPKEFPIFMLFNPWCKDDAVFLESEELRQEYVMNDTGKIWMGTEKNNSAYAWNYGQFEPTVLPAVKTILEKALIPNSFRGDVVRVVRAVATVISARRNDNVIQVKYDTPYKGGVCPRQWQGSVRILESYNYNRQPVKYGTCAVVAAVTNTVFRCLGVPTRLVTNFNSCRDSDNNLMYEVFVDEKAVVHGRVENMDGLWTYHSWNEMWMTRDDLRKGYCGWQAVDASPQQVHERYHIFGPTSVAAIRSGSIGLKYDVSLVFAEVNADVIYWFYKYEDPRSKVILLDKEQVGTSIITKKPGIVTDGGDYDKDNIVNNYKPKEGSTEERKSLLSAIAARRAELYGSAARALSYGLSLLRLKNPETPSEKPPPFTCKLIVPQDVELGNGFTVTAKIGNTSPAHEKCEFTMVLEAMSYTGMVYNVIKTTEICLNIPDKKEETVNMDISLDDYLNKLADLPLFNLRAVVVPPESNDVTVIEDKFGLTLPKIKIKLEGTMKAREESFLTFNFRNPLPIELTDCKFYIEGAGFRVTGDVPIRDVKPMGRAEGQGTVTPREAGKKVLLITFWSKELRSIQGVLSCNVASP